MMTTCRLLCALLVLALCCCPSVCAADAVEDEPTSLISLSPQSGEEVERVETEQKLGTSGRPGEGSQNIVDQTPGTKTDTEQPLNRVMTPHTEGGAPVAAEEQITTNSEQATTGETETAQKTEERTLKPEVTDHSDVQQPTGQTSQMKVSDIENTATNKITTTTTTAPEATSTTSTEAPTTTTTRAPSRLREVDGSLSSSAWVCAPLVLAASALAYTTLG
ncbi:mucin TcMUCII [Trypanosoma cruzi cruzi]|uniref:Putative mucin TcMUCII n=1 Tax=Trypanosoma cruzi TaxID=5693 RepID=A0A2V2UQU7_TRYCR|nr:mucin TcMUCII [Trypanosoma cruzi cruzi]PWU86440.1 putative mucin TcMUCII [Trypanosoma cruzi]